MANEKHRFYFHDDEAGDYSTNSHNRAHDYLLDHSYMGTKPVHLRTRHPDGSTTMQTFHPGDISALPKLHKLN